MLNYGYLSFSVLVLEVVKTLNGVSEEPIPGCYEREVDLKRRTAAEVAFAAVLLYGEDWIICASR